MKKITHRNKKKAMLWKRHKDWLPRDSTTKGRGKKKKVWRKGS